MPVNLSIKNVPDALAENVRRRAQRNHRSLQGELMALLEAAANDSGAMVVRAPEGAPYRAESPAEPIAATDGLLARLTAIAGERGIDAGKRLTRDEVHDRTALRKAQV